MQSLGSSKKTSRRLSPALGLILGAMMLLLVVGSSHLVQWLHPGQTITPNTVQKLEEVPILMRHDKAISSNTSGGIFSIAFNSHPTEDISFASNSYDGMVKLWNLKEGATKEGATEVLAMRAGVRVAFSADGKRLASIDYSRDDQGSVKLWDLTQIANMVQSLKENQQVYAVSFSPDGQTLASGSADGMIKLWNWRMGKVLYTLKGHETGVSAIAFSPDGQTLASSGNDGITLWNWRSSKALHTLKVDKDGVGSIAFSPDGQTLASRGNDGTIKLWHWQDSQVIRTLQASAPDFDSHSIAFSPDGQTLASDSQDGIKLWHWSDGTERFTIKEGNFPFAFSPDGKTLASDSHNGTVKLWNQSDSRFIRSFQGREKARTSLAFSPNGQTLVSAGYEGGITLWNLSDGTEQLRIPIKEGSIATSVAFNPDGQTLAIVNGDKAITLLSLDYQAKLAIPLDVKLKNGRFVAFTPDKQTLILANTKQIKLLRLQDRHEIREIKGEPDEISIAFALSPNAQIVASSILDGPIKLWSLQDGKLIRSLTSDDKHTVLSLAFSPDGQMLASGNPFERTIQVWNVSNGKLMHRWEANSVLRVAFSPDGQLLASNGSGGEIQLWNPQTGTKLRTLKGHASGISALAFSPDGQTLASGSTDQTIKLWRVKP